MTILPTDLSVSPQPAGMAGTAISAIGREIPDATVARLPVYLRALSAFTDQRIYTCSSLELAEATGVNPAKLRKDLSFLGSYGVRGVGYEVEYLSYQISQAMGQTQDWNVLIVGAGHLGRALAGYRGFATRGFTIAALVDADPERIGTDVEGLIIGNIADVADIVSVQSITIAVITTPADAAQDAADCLVSAGVVSILNFAPALLSVPEHVDVRKVDMSTELQILAYHQQRRAKEGSS